MRNIILKTVSVYLVGLCVLLNGIPGVHAQNAGPAVRPPVGSGVATTKTAVVHFLGLCTLVNANPGVHVVMPDTGRSSHAVDPHTAIIAFPSCSLQHSDWPIEKLHAVSNYNFIRIGGAHIEIGADQSNPPATIPAGLPRLTHGCARVMAQERSTAMHAADGNPPSLNEDYRPPNYRAAAGVVKISRGTLFACSENADEPSPRVDTKAAIGNNGTITFETANGRRRRLILTGDARVLVGNFPDSWINGELTSASEAGHFAVYHSMLTTTSGCQREVVTAVSCTTADARTMERANPYPFPFQETARMTAECSNTTYP